MANDILHLGNLVAAVVINNGDYYEVEALGDVAPTACPECRSELYRHGSRPQIYMDTPIHGKRVILKIDRKRYRCKVCGKTLFEPLPDIDDKRQATTRLVKHIEFHCLRKTFADLSREVGVDSKTIRHIFDDYILRLNATVHFETPQVLGIDELKIVGQYRAMLTNVDKQSLFDMLPTRNKVDLIAYFKKLPDKHKVEILTMDLWNVYKQVAQDQFPGRMVVADRFHVVRMANDAIERMRKMIRKSLDSKSRLKLKDDRFVLLSRYNNLTSSQLDKLEHWTAQFPLLGASYAAKEGFHNIYSHSNKSDAMRAAKEWEQNIDPAVEWAFREVKVALNNWWDEIFNYYDHPITNAYTESVNNLAKGMNRMGRGYSFEVIRARLLYDDEARKDTRTTIRKKPRVANTTQGAGRISTSTLFKTSIDDEAQSIEYGPYIPTLARKLEDGEFE